MKIILFLTIVGLFFISCSEDPNKSLYKLSVEVTGHGSFEVSPDKNDYEDGEAVTLTAIADTGWRFRKWEGNVSSNANPLQLNMNENKSIRVVFAVPFEPDITGNWDGVQYAIAFELEQPDIFDSTLTGKFIVHLQNGDLEYSVTGFNDNPIAKMYCSRQGYYTIEYSGLWANNTVINGELIEAGYHYACDLVKTTDSPLPKGGKLFNPKTIVE